MNEHTIECAVPFGHIAETVCRIVTARNVKLIHHTRNDTGEECCGGLLLHCAVIRMCVSGNISKGLALLGVVKMCLG